MSRQVVRLRRCGGIDHLVQSENPCRHPVNGDIFVFAHAFDAISADHFDPTDLQQRECELFMRSVFKQKHSLQLSRVACRDLSVCLQDRFETQPRMLNDSRHIGNQGDASVAHDRGAVENTHAFHRRMHRLDHYFFGPVDFVNHQPKATSRQLENQNIRDSWRSSCSWMRCQNFGLGFSSERRRSIDNVLEAYDR